MTTNDRMGNGMIRDHSQTHSVLRVKLDTYYGKFMDVKQNRTQFKGIRKEK